MRTLKPETWHPIRRGSRRNSEPEILNSASWLLLFRALYPDLRCFPAQKLCSVEAMTEEQANQPVPIVLAANNCRHHPRPPPSKKRKLMPSTKESLLDGSWGLLGEVCSGCPKLLTSMGGAALVEARDAKNRKTERKACRSGYPGLGYPRLGYPTRKLYVPAHTGGP